MKKITLTLTKMAHGGSALGQDRQNRSIFVPYAIPGEQAEVQIVSEKRQYARGQLLEIKKAAKERVEARCPHFGTCGGCHFQHIEYGAQLRYKQKIVADQLQRIGNLKQVEVKATLPHPEPWQYRREVSLSPVKEVSREANGRSTSADDTSLPIESDTPPTINSTINQLGFWSPHEQRVIPIDTCPILHEDLLNLWQDVDLNLPGLRKLTLRRGDDGALMAIFEVDGVEPPELVVDFPLSVSIVLPDKTAASLVGDPYLLQTIKERDFRVSAGCHFYPSPIMAEKLINKVLTYAQLTGSESVIETECGSGILTNFLAQECAELIAIESNPDAVNDMGGNLDSHNNIVVYQGKAVEILPHLTTVNPDVMIVNPPATGLETAVIKEINRKRPSRLIYISQDVATMARDHKALSRGGYRFQEAQPIDMTPHHFQTIVVGLWSKIDN